MRFLIITRRPLKPRRMVYIYRYEIRIGINNTVDRCRTWPRGGVGEGKNNDSIFWPRTCSVVDHPSLTLLIYQR